METLAFTAGASPLYILFCKLVVCVKYMAPVFMSLLFLLPFDYVTTFCNTNSSRFFYSNEHHDLEITMLPRLAPLVLPPPRQTFQVSQRQERRPLRLHSTALPWSCWERIA